MKNFISNGDSIQVVAPEGGVVGGFPFVKGGIVGIAMSSAGAGEKFTLKIKGTFAGIKKVAGESWVAGSALYLTNELELSSDSENSQFLGYAYYGAAPDDITSSVILIQSPGRQEVTPDPPSEQQFFGTGGPDDNVYDSVTGRRIYILTPAGYNSSVPTALNIFLHGTGQVGTNIEDVLQDGLPQVISETGQLMKCLTGCPQLSTGGWSEYLAAIAKSINYMKANYNVDSNKIYLTGLSNGAEGVIAFLIDHEIEIAGYCISSPPESDAVSEASKIKDTPGFWIVGLSDTTVGPGNTAGPLSALLAQNGRISPLSKFIFGADHSRMTWNDHLFNYTSAGWNFEDWLLLHSLVREDEAANYTTRAEDSQDYLHYLEAKKLVSLLSASDEKTELLSRLSDLQAFHETGKTRILLSFGTVSYPATGNYNQVDSTESASSVGPLIDMDGNTTGASITFDHTQWDWPLDGQPGSYHGFDKGVFAECRRIYSGNTWSLGGLSNESTCRIDIFPYYKTESGTAHYGISGTIGGVTKNSVDDVYNVMNYLTWEGVQPSGGEIEMTLNAQYPDDSNDGAICAIMLTITTP